MCGIIFLGQDRKGGLVSGCSQVSGSTQIGWKFSAANPEAGCYSIASANSGSTALFSLKLQTAGAPAYYCWLLIGCPSSKTFLLLDLDIDIFFRHGRRSQKG